MFARPIVILSRQAKNLVSRRFTLFYWRSFAIAQDDNLGVVGILTKRANCNASVKSDDSAPRCRGGFPRPPVDFDVTCPSVTRFARATSPTSGEVYGTVKTVPYARNTFYRVGRGLAPAVNSHQTPRREQAPALPHKFIPTNPTFHFSPFFPQCQKAGAALFAVRKWRGGFFQHGAVFPKNAVV